MEPITERMETALTDSSLQNLGIAGMAVPASSAARLFGFTGQAADDANQDCMRRITRDAVARRVGIRLENFDNQLHCY